MGKGIVLLWRKVGGENIPRLTGRTGCPNRNSTEEPVPEAGSRYRRGFSFLCACPGLVRGQGSIREGAFCPMPCIRGLAQGLLSLAPGVWTERHRSIPEIFQLAFAPYPGPCPPGYVYRERVSPARLSTGLLPIPRRSPAGGFFCRFCRRGPADPEKIRRNPAFKGEKCSFACVKLQDPVSYR